MRENSLDQLTKYNFGVMSPFLVNLDSVYTQRYLSTLLLLL